MHPRRKEIWEYIETHHFKPVIMTTNAGLMDYVPKIDLIIISFNGGTKESYEYTTGADFNKTVARIREHYPELSKRNVEMHCLMWEGNEGTEKDLAELWKDFPGKIRLSYKYDNQMKEDKTIEKYKNNDRVYCDYLNMLSIMPDGKIISCAHDFEAVTDFGNIFTDSMDSVMMNKNRKKKQHEHYEGIYSGLCKDCNYNTSLVGKFKYIK